MAHIVALVLTSKKKEIPTALDVELIWAILSGVTASFMHVLKITKLDTADYAENFHVTYLSINMIQNMARKAPLREQDFWFIERKLAIKNT